MITHLAETAGTFLVMYTIGGCIAMILGGIVAAIKN